MSALTLMLIIAILPTLAVFESQRLEACNGSQETFQSLDAQDITSGKLLGYPRQSGPERVCFWLCSRLNCTLIGRLRYREREESLCWFGGLGEEMLVQLPVSNVSEFERVYYPVSLQNVNQQLLITHSSESSVYGTTSNLLYDGLKIRDVPIFHTTNDYEPWARLFLEAPALVGRMIVWNRNETGVEQASKNRSKDLEFRVALTVARLMAESSFCAYFEPVIEDEQPITCVRPIPGSVVQIQIRHRTDHMNLAEVEIFGAKLF